MEESHTVEHLMLEAQTGRLYQLLLTNVKIHSL